MTGTTALVSRRVAVVGLGLMGGSLAGALRGRCERVTGVDRRADAVAVALDRGLVDRGTTWLDDGVGGADAVVLATPVRTILHQLDEVAPLLAPGTLLMDLGSTKARIVASMARLPDHVEPLGGHPMCGREASGVEAADPDLYRGTTFILSPLPRTSPAALALGRGLVEAAGARPLVLAPARQDALVATLSHLPYLLACGLVAAADATTSADPAAWQIVASGFRDTARVAGSHVEMWADILLTNRDEVLRAVRAFDTQLGRLAELVDAGDEAGLREALRYTRARRREMFP